MPGIGSLWMPHVYMPNQNPTDLSGTNAMGRWDYSQWFWPPTMPTHGTVPNPYYVPNTSEGPEIPGINNPSLTPESFMDTPIVNGVAYPYLALEQKVYRFRILNASNDRSLNLQIYYAKSNGDMWDVQGNLNDPNAGEVDMVPAIGKPLPMGVVPPWPNDNRMGGVPNKNTVGPSFVQIGTEGGFLPAPVVLRNRPVGYENNLRNIVVTNINTQTLMLAPAERADVIIDFSKVPAGSKLILYNDSPAPVPAFDPRYDYYTGDLDQSDTGGAPTTLPGYGPNTRTIMQFQVSGPDANPTGLRYDQDSARMSNLKTALQATFAASQDPIIVPQPVYNGAYGKSFAPVSARIQNTSLTFTPNGGTSITLGMKPKAIQELFETAYGRMNATLGVEIPNTTGVNQTTIPLGYIDPSTENIDDSITPAAPALGDGTQIWKVTHNGVDTHAIHFHLFNVQIINRVGWDGQVRLPEPNEIGWKDTVRMNPLEDAIVALRPISAKSPFGTYQSIRPLDVTMPVGSQMNFWPQDQFGNPVQTVNKLFNFGDEYVWHCHLLGHEENDMMRPIVFTTGRVAPDAPGFVTVANLDSAGAAVGKVVLTWPDATPPTPGFGVNGTTWGDPKGEIGYIILRQAPGESGFTEIGRTSANATSYTDSTVAAGNYSYKVVAFNDAGGSGVTIGTNTALAPSAPVAVTVAGTAVAPDAPTGLAYSFLTPAWGVNLTWTAATGHVTGYTIERSANGTSGWRALNSAVITGTSFTDTGVAANTSYFYHVIAKNATGTTTSAPLAVLTVPSAPTNLSTVPLPTAVTLNWNAPSGSGALTGYTIERSSNLVSWLKIGTAADTTYTDGSVMSNATYFYRVSASNATGTGAATPWIAVTVQSTLPSAPINMNATPQVGPQVSLVWAPGNTITVNTYRVYRSTDVAGPWDQVGTTTSPAFNDTSANGLIVNTIYYYHVIPNTAAYNPGDGPASANLQVVTLPDAPTALTGTLSPSGAAVDLSWTAPVGGAASYQVQSSTDGSNWTNLGTATTVTTYTDASGIAGSTYFYQVLANNMTPAAGSPSNVITITLPLALPNVATSLTATLSASGVALNWTAPTGVVTEYQIERRTSAVGNVAASGWAPVGIATTAAYTDTTTATNTSYDYQVIAKNAAGSGPASDFATLLTLPEAPTGLTVTPSAAGVSLNWVVPAGSGTITSYTIKQRTSAVGATAAGAWSIIGTTPGTTANASALQGNTSYDYLIIATNATGDGPAASITALTLPDAPTSLNGTVNATGMNLLWTAPGGTGSITGYTLERSPAGGNNWTVLSSMIAGTSFADNTGVSNTSYDYRVTAANAAGSSAASTIATLLTLPGAATNLKASLVAGKINLTWTPPSGTGTISGYNVQRSTDNGTTWTTVNSTLTPTPSFTDAPAITANTVYAYSVTASNATGAGQPSAVATLLTVPAAPTLASSIQFGPQVVLTLASTGNGTITSYAIQRRTSAVGRTPAGAWSAPSVVTGATYTDSTVAANTSYDYQATATNGAGTGPLSAILKVTLPALPTAPTNLAVRATGGYAALTWKNNGTNQTNVIIERSLAGTTLTFTQVGQVAGTVTAFTDNTITPLASYVYRVRAINATGSSPASNQATFTAPFAAPSGLSSLTITTNAITVQWTGNTPNGTGFVVERLVGATWTQVGTVAQTAATTYSFTNTGLTTRTSYQYRVRAYYTPAGGGATISSANSATLTVRTR